MAWNCWVKPAATDGLAGLTWMALRTGLLLLLLHPASRRVRAIAGRIRSLFTVASLSAIGVVEGPYPSNAFGNDASRRLAGVPNYGNDKPAEPY